MENFWKKVKVTKNKTECWPWQGRVNKQGHGSYVIDHSPMLSHWVALLFTTGLPLGSYTIAHTCSNPRCCNPNHLKPTPVPQKGSQHRTNLDKAEQYEISMQLRRKWDTPQAIATEHQISIEEVNRISKLGQTK